MDTDLEWPDMYDILSERRLCELTRLRPASECVRFSALSNFVLPSRTEPVSDDFVGLRPYQHWYHDLVVAAETVARHALQIEREGVRATHVSVHGNFVYVGHVPPSEEEECTAAIARLTV